jgi:diacylglycerol kinase (ATP)
LVLACGGDGTLNEVVNGLAATATPLGLLPGGTANMAARELGLPLDPLRAAQELPRWSPRRIALGRAIWPASGPPSQNTGGPESRYFFSVAGVGFDAHIVYKLSSGLKMSLGVAGYVLEALRQVARYPFPLTTLKADNNELRATFAIVQRTRVYAGWLHTAPTADLFAPRFALCAFPSQSRLRYFLYAGAVLARLHLRLKDVKLVDASKVTCSPPDSQTRVHVELDGELAGILPVTFEVVPDSLTLLVP